jgi:hypothetical protein
VSEFQGASSEKRRWIYSSVFPEACIENGELHARSVFGLSFTYTVQALINLEPYVERILSQNPKLASKMKRLHRLDDAFFEKQDMTSFRLMKKLAKEVENELTKSAAALGDFGSIKLLNPTMSTKEIGERVRMIRKAVGKKAFT